MYILFCSVPFKVFVLRGLVRTDATQLPQDEGDPCKMEFTVVADRIGFFDALVKAKRIADERIWDDWQIEIESDM